MVVKYILLKTASLQWLNKKMQLKMDLFFFHNGRLDLSALLQLLVNIREALQAPNTNKTTK